MILAVAILVAWIAGFATGHYAARPLWHSSHTPHRQIDEMAVTNGDTNERTQHWPDK